MRVCMLPRGVICALLVLFQFVGTHGKQNLSLPVFKSTGREYGPMCVKQHQEYCVGHPRAYTTVGTILNGSYQAPVFADMNGDGRPDLITAHTGNKSIMIFYNQGDGRDRLPVFEAAASVIVPSTQVVHALHAVRWRAATGVEPWPTYLLASVEVKADGDLIIPMLDNIGNLTHPQLLWRHGHASCLHELDLKSQFIREELYDNVLAQGGRLRMMLGMGDLDADGDLDLIVQVTWLTLYYENVGEPDHRHSIYATRPSTNLVTTGLRYYGPPVLFDMDNDGDLDVITVVGDDSNGMSAQVYENVGTKYHPEMLGLSEHAIMDVFASVCAGLGFGCSLNVEDYHGNERGHHADLVFGGEGVGRLLVYPQGRATSFLFETKWNNPFDVVESNSAGFFYQHFGDVDGDGDLDMFVRQWILSPVRTMQVDLYENQGTVQTPNYVHASTYRREGLYYFAVSRVLGRKHPVTGLDLFDFLLTNGTGTVYVSKNMNDSSLNISRLTEPEPLMDVDFPAGKIRLFDDDHDGKPEMYVTNAYGDLDGMLESQLYTGTNHSKLLFDEAHKQTCNRINVLRYNQRTAWRHGLTRPLYQPNGSVTVNMSGCISDIFIGDYRDFNKPTLIAVAFPLSKVLTFEPETWTSYNTTLQLSDGVEVVDATLGDTIPVSATLVDLDGDGNAGMLVAYIRGLRSWRADYCEFQFPCWRGGKCDYNGFHPKCTCSTEFEGELCDTCAPDHYGKACTKCPVGENGDVCSAKGVCKWGNFAQGNCVCTAPFSGINCSSGVCPAGTETNYNFTNGTLECEWCRTSYFKDAPGDQRCIRCPPFSRASDDRQTCDCYADYYLSDVDDMLACKACPSPMITIQEAATSIYHCVCPAGYYLSKDDAGSLGTCLPCPEGAACSVPGITLETLPLLPNYWRISNKSATIGRCKLQTACPGTDLMQWKQDVWLKGGKWHGFEDSLCGAGYDGPFCSACLPGHFKRNRRCLPCAPKAVTTRNVALGFTTVLLLALGAWLAYRRVVTPHIQRVFNVDPGATHGASTQQLNATARVPHALSTAANPVLRSPIRNAAEPTLSCAPLGQGGPSMTTREVVLALPAVYKRLRAVLGVKLRLLIIYLQVMSCLWNILDLDASEDTPIIDEVMSMLTWFDLDFAAFPSYQCVLGDSYYNILLMYTYGPVLLLVLLWGVTLLLCRRAKWAPGKVLMYKDYATTASLAICFLLFAGQSTRLLNFFACLRLDDGHLYNLSDMRVRCDVASYQAMIPFVIFGILLYPIGITCLYAYLLYKDRPRICARPDKSVGEVLALRDADRVAKRSKFLWSPYEPRVWWYEVGECVRRLSLTAFLSVYQTGKTQQAVAAILLSVGSIIVFDHYMPYLLDEDDSMGKVCNYVTLLTFLVALLTKLEYIQRVYFTELLLFILALSVAVVGVALSAKQLSRPTASKAPQCRRSSLLKKHLKTMDAEATETAERLARTQERGDTAQAQRPRAASPPPPALPHADDPSDTLNPLTHTSRAFLHPSSPLPPLPGRVPGRPLFPPLTGGPALHAFEEPGYPTGTGTATLSTTFNALLHQRSSLDDNSSSSGHQSNDRYSGVRESGGRHDAQLNGSDNNAYAAGIMRTTTGRPEPIDAAAGGVAAIVSPSDPPMSLTSALMQEHARADSPTAPPLPPYE